LLEVGTGLIHKCFDNRLFHFGAPAAIAFSLKIGYRFDILIF